jgi:hypothetical protein
MEISFDTHPNASVKDILQWHLTAISLTFLEDLQTFGSKS